MICKNNLLLNNLNKFYAMPGNIEHMLKIVNGESLSLRIVDWFVTNYAKKNFTTYNIDKTTDNINRRFKVYNEYKLKLRAYSKKKFDPFCRHFHMSVPYINNTHIETTLGQLNFFKWVIENNIITYITENYDIIEHDMTTRNSISKRQTNPKTKTRKKREELSVSASKSVKTENIDVEIVFHQ